MKNYSSHVIMYFKYLSCIYTYTPINSIYKKGNKVIKDQFDVIAEKLIKSERQREAVSLHMLEGLTAYEAENRIYGRTTATASRDAKRINKEFDFCMLVANSK